MSLKDDVEKLKQEIKKLQKAGRSKVGDFMPKAVRQQDIDGIVVFRGDAADRPTNGSTEVQAFFAEDTSAFSIWNTTNEAWESTTLS